MKTSSRLLRIAGILCAGLLTLNAADKKQLGGPKGGRFLETTEPKAEFFLQTDRTASITFYDTALKPVPASTQTVTAIADTKAGKERIEFEKRAGLLVSKTKLPEGDALPLVIQFKQSPDAKPQNFRFSLDTHTCAGCKRAEYACTCGH